MGIFDRFKKKDIYQAKTTLVPGVGRIPYPAYRGTEPYIFVSYAHADSDRVFKEIARFNEDGFHVWYDEGINPGNEWTDEIAQALENCSLFIVFLTRNSVNSPNVKDEINFVIDEDTPAIGIYLEECELSRGLKLRFKRKQAILKYSLSEEEYRYKYITAFERMNLHPDKVSSPISPEKQPAVPAADSVPAADIEKKTVQTETKPAAVQPSSDVNVPSACALPASEHKWGSYVPKGTALITTKDGTVHTAVANSLVFCSKNVGGYSPPNPWLFEGLQTLDDSDHNQQGPLYYFIDLESVCSSGDKLIVTDIDGEEAEIELHPEAEVWYIGEKDSNLPQSVKAVDIEKIAFDRRKTPSTVIRYACVATKSGSFMSPYAYILYRGIIQRNDWGFTKDLTAIASMPTNFNRLSKITVTKNGRDGQGMFIRATDMEMSAIAKNGAELNITLNTGSFYAMSANGMMRKLSREDLSEIDLLPG